MPESKFTSNQALEVAAACAAHQVDYLFIGKSGAILLGYPATTQDVDLFLPKDRRNGARMIRALKSIGFKLSRAIQKKILSGADFVKLVKENSEDASSKAKDGDMGTMSRADNLPESIRSVVFGLKAGEVSDPRVDDIDGMYIDVEHDLLGDER